MQWSQDLSTQQVSVTLNPTNGLDAVKNLFKNALNGELYAIPGASNLVYANNIGRNATDDPIKFYADKSTHVVGLSTPSTLVSYLREYLYDNLTKSVGLAATTGDVDITFTRNGVEASESVAEQIAQALYSSQTARYSIYEQMISTVSERFSTLQTTNQQQPQNLPFIANDSLDVRVTFHFPATHIETPVVQNSLRIGSNLFMATGSKISVISPANPVKKPVLSDLPSCSVVIRAKLGT